MEADTTGAVKDSKDDEKEEKTSVKRWLFFFFSGMILFTVVYTLFFVELQRILFDHRGTFLFSGPNYGVLVAVMAVVQSPFAVVALSQMLKRQRPQLSIFFWVICGLAFLPVILRFPVYRSIDAAGIHQSQFYGVQQTIPWSALDLYEFNAYRTMKGTYIVNVGFHRIDDPTHPVFITLPQSNAGAWSASAIQFFAQRHDLQDVTHKYPADSKFISVLASGNGQVWNNFVTGEFLEH